MHSQVLQTQNRCEVGKMHILWKKIARSSFSKQRKMKLMLISNTLLFTIAGIILWGGIQLFALQEIKWAICFAGYAGFFPGFLGGVLFLYRYHV